MNPLPTCVRTLTLSGCFCLTLALAGTGTSHAGELLPFPTQERSNPYAQQSPRYQPSLPEQQMEGFRQDISRLPCPELNRLRSQLKEQYDGAVSSADQEYYASFLQGLERELANRCTK